MGKLNTKKACITDDSRRVFLKKASNLFIDKLFGDDNDLNLQVVDSRLVSGFPNNANGWAMPVQPGYYQIAIQHEYLTDNHQLLSTFAHEFGHIQQYMSGDLVYEEGIGITWRGRLFREDSFRNTVVADWASRPWEMHANGVRDFLLKTYKSDLI